MLKNNTYYLIFLLIALIGCKINLAEKPPNFILFYVDDLGWKDVGFMGNEFHETPNIDQMAKEGMIFNNAYANAPNCAPSRACLMTGQYAPRHGIYTVGSAERGKLKNRKLIPVENKTILAAEKTTIAEVLKENGYTCGHFGKWHLGDSLTGPLNNGFDVNIGGNKKGHPKSYFSPYENKNIMDGKDGEHLTDRLTDEAISFLEKNKDQPFFIYLPFYAVHTPFQAKDSLINKYEQKRDSTKKQNPVYAAMLETVDKNISRMIEKTEALNLSENTIFIFYSDNGNHFKASSAKPLRGSKGMLYEGGIRVPLVIKWEGKIKANSICETPVIGTDFFPTLLKLANIQKPKDLILDGVEISPLLFQSGTIKERLIYWHFPAYLESYGGMKQKWRQTPASAIRQGDWKLIENFETGELELYNLKKDISEQHDLSEINVAKKQELFSELKKWQQKTDAFLDLEINPAYKN